MSFETLECRIRQSDKVLTRAVGTETVLLNLKNEEYFTLDEVGADMWNLIDGIRTLQEVADEMSRMYEADPDQIAQDIRDLVEELAREGLVVAV